MATSSNGLLICALKPASRAGYIVRFDVADLGAVELRVA